MASFAAFVASRRSRDRAPVFLGTSGISAAHGGAVRIAYEDAARTSAPHYQAESEC